MGTPARRPVAVVPAPPWCTTARQSGKTAAKFVARTHLDMVEMGTSTEVAPPGANQCPLAQLRACRSDHGKRVGRRFHRHAAKAK